MAAKIADLGMASIAPLSRAMATMTTAPGALLYMSPEALEVTSAEEEKQTSHYGTKVDIAICIWCCSHFCTQPFISQETAGSHFHCQWGLIARLEELE